MATILHFIYHNMHVTEHIEGRADATYLYCRYDNLMTCVYHLLPADYIILSISVI